MRSNDNTDTHTLIHHRWTSPLKDMASYLIFFLFLLFLTSAHIFQWALLCCLATLQSVVSVCVCLCLSVFVIVFYIIC